MKFIFLCVFATIAAASRNHHHYVVLQNTDAAGAGFGHQDTNGFYTIIHNGEDLPKPSDSPSNGLHTYLESSGKGQPDSDVNILDINCPPEPVTDTPEVEMARQAHFEAYREAALMAAMAPDDDMVNESSEHNLNVEQVAELQQNTRDLLINKQNSRKQLVASRKAHGHERVGQEIGQQQQKQLVTTYILTAKAEAHAHASGQGIVHAQAQIEHPIRPELKIVSESSLESLSPEMGHSHGNGNGNGHSIENGNGNGNGNANGRSSDKGNGNGNNGHQMENGNGVSNGNGNGVDIVHPNGNGKGNGPHNDNNNSANGNGLNNGISHLTANGHANSIGHGNIHSLIFDEPHGINKDASDTTYYTVDTPDTHYTVVIPTVLTTLPRIESIRLGENGDASSLPVSKSFTYITQRLKSSAF